MRAMILEAPGQSLLLADLPLPTSAFASPFQRVTPIYKLHHCYVLG
jgi:hypothetical protein